MGSVSPRKPLPSDHSCLLSLLKPPLSVLSDLKFLGFFLCSSWGQCSQFQPSFSVGCRLRSSEPCSTNHQTPVLNSPSPLNSLGNKIVETVGRFLYTCVQQQAGCPSPSDNYSSSQGCMLHLARHSCPGKGIECIQSAP